MVDYQEMYYKMNRAMEKAIGILVDAQRECEEDYLRQTEPAGKPEQSAACRSDTEGSPAIS